MNNSYITIIKEKRTALSRKRIPLNQNGCTANFRIGVPFEQNLQFDCWLVLRGMKTLGIRMERSQENAEQIAAWLQKQKAVTKVIYPGLPDHPGHEIMKKQARGFGAMLTIQLESKEFALAILEKVRMIRFAESLGGVETLVTYPTTQTHADVPKEIRERNGITESTLRFSVGIENIEDLIGELEKVFAEIEEEKNDGKKS